MNVEGSLLKEDIDGNQGKEECEEVQAAKGEEGKEEIGVLNLKW